MPISSYLQTSLVRDANIAMATAFFPRWRGGFWQKLCGSTLSTALVEPFALEGAAPLMKQWLGDVSSRAIASWKQQSPNLLFKNYEEVSRTDLEMNQTGTILKRVGQIGIRVAQAPDYLLAAKIMSGSLTSSASVVFSDGNTYYTTFEQGVPIFSTAHNTYASNVQSNIIQGNLPSTIANVKLADPAQLAADMQKDLTALLDALAGVLDDKGGQIYPDLEPELHIVAVVPPILKYAASLAFKTPGALIGGSPSTSNGSTGSTVNIAPMFIKDVISSPLLKGCADIQNQDDTARVTPVHDTDYYFFITNDYVKPFYFQRFRPKEKGEFSPPGINADQQVQEALAAVKAIGLKATAESQDVYAATIVDHNLAALGAQAQESVVKKEAFFMSGRTRFNINYGPWFTAWKIDPTGTSG